MRRPQTPMVRLMVDCQRRTPAEKPRSRVGSTSRPRVIRSASTPGPVCSPSGVSGTKLVVVGAALDAVRGVDATVPSGPELPGPGTVEGTALDGSLVPGSGSGPPLVHPPSAAADA